LDLEIASLYLALRDFVDPLRRRLESPESLEYLFHRYGWVAPLDPPVYEELLGRVGFKAPLDEFLRVAEILQARLDADPGGGSLQEADIVALARAGGGIVRALAELRPSSLGGLPDPFGRQDFWESLGDHVLDDLLEEYLRVHKPLIFLVLRLWGAIRYEPTQPAGPHRRAYVRTIVDVGQAVAIVTEPLPALQRAYHWGDPTRPFDHEGAIDALGSVLHAVGLPARRISPALLHSAPFAPDPGRRVQDDASGLRSILLRSASPVDQTFYRAGFEVYSAAIGADAIPSGLLVKPLLEGGTGVAVTLGDTSLRWTVGAAAADVVGFAIFPGSAVVVGGDAAIGTSLVLASAGDRVIYLLGNARTSRIEVTGWSVGLALEGSPADPEIRLRVAAEAPDGKAGVRVVIPLEDADSFVKQSVKKSAIEFAFATDVVWSSKTGLRFGGRPTLDIGLPLLIDLGAVTLTDARISLGGSAETLVVRLTTGVRGSLGPVEFAVENVGLEVGVERRTRQQVASAPAGGDGAAAATFGNLDASVAFHPPDGVGLVIDAGPVKGGGFLRFDRERGVYGGALELVVGRVQVKSFGLLTARSDGYSLIVVMTAEFPEPITLPFGWRLAGVGGLLGIHHRLDVPALQAALRTGVAGELLFPKDPITAAPKILTSLATVFPAAGGQIVVGPLFRLFWGARGLVSLSVAVILELPNPVRVLILGRLDVTAPHKGFELLVLRVEFAGVVDFERPSLELDAPIVDSHLGPFALTGDVAVRMRGGEESLFLLTAGGFHPQFPIPTNANLPALRRIAVALSSGDNPRARVELYTAITSSTWQIGGKLEVSASKAGFTAEARLSVDAIFGEITEDGRTSCGFIAEIEGRAAIKRGSTTIAGVGLTITLTGTEPWHVAGKAKISFFFFSVSIPFEGTFGERADRPALPLVDAAALLEEAISERTSWETGLRAGTRPLVTLAAAPTDADVIVAHPRGQIALRQHAFPLGVEITRVGGSRTTPDRYEIDSVAVGAETPPWTALRSPFAAGQYLDLSEDERFTRPAFEPLVSGFELTSEGESRGPATAADLSYEEIVIGPEGPLAEPRPGRPGFLAVFAHAASFGAAAMTILRRDERGGAAGGAAGTVRVRDVPPLVADPVTLRAVGIPGLPSAVTYTEVTQALGRQVVRGAVTPDDLIVIGAHEAAH
jgi:hypothetical protein